MDLTNLTKMKNWGSKCTIPGFKENPTYIILFILDLDEHHLFYEVVIICIYKTVAKQGLLILELLTVR